jgi:hypothetical protein
MVKEVTIKITNKFLIEVHFWCWFLISYFVIMGYLVPNKITLITGIVITFIVFLISLLFSIKSIKEVKQQ